MDTNDSLRDERFRFPNLLRQYTKVNDSLASPAKSVHPEHMESMTSQAAFVYRTTDFSDGGSSDEEHGRALGSPELDMVERRVSPSKRKRPPPSAQPLVSRCEPKHCSMLADGDGYQRLDSNINNQSPHLSNDSASFGETIEELNLPQKPGEDVSSLPRRARLSQGRMDRSSRTWDPSMPFPPRTNVSGDIHDQRVDAHFLAHAFLLRGMLANPELGEHGPTPSSAGSRLSAVRRSIPPHQYNFGTIRDQPFRSKSLERSTSSIAREKKKVHVVPPPIDTTTKQSMPADYVRTPYPFREVKSYSKDIAHEPLSANESPIDATESILTLTIRKLNPNSRTRIATITIPASNDYSAERNTQSSEKHNRYKPATFDDEQFLLQLRKSYAQMTGPLRFFLARSLTRIAVSGQATRAADADYGWIYQSRSPHFLAYKGLIDTCSEEKILHSYRRPALGRSRFAFVHWAHRLAAAPNMSKPPPAERSPENANSDLVRKAEQHEGLDFVASWSIARISFALFIVMVMSVAAPLLWTFLGKNGVSPPPLQQQGAGLLDAGDRVGTGVLIGICVFLFGSGGIAGWLGVSWLVM